MADLADEPMITETLLDGEDECKEYDVYIKPYVSNDRQSYILQFPNRSAGHNYSAAAGALPLKMRIKPQAKMVEMDVPMDAFNNYDTDKGLKWGDAMKRSNHSKGGGSHGLPGGFGIGGQQPGARGRGKGIEDEQVQQRILEDYANAVKTEQVLARQTLGGQAVPAEKTTPQYMIGTFQGNQLHLIPVDEIVQMRPQFHHIDAHAEQERAGRGRDPAAMTTAKEARAVHMTIKQNNDDAEAEGSEIPMSERIAAAQSEQWKLQQFMDEDTDPAWLVYAEEAFVGVNLPEPDPKPDSPLDLKDQLGTMAGSLDPPEYLNAVSGQRDAVRLMRSKMKLENEEGKGKGKEGQVSSDSEG